MGKSKRIRYDRAQDVMTRPGKYSDVKAAKKAKNTTIILVCIIAAIILASVALIIFNETGALARGKVLYESENFEINGAMATYMYMNVYQQYYATYGEYAQYFMSGDATTIIGAKTILARCEAAKAAGYTLTDADLAEIDETVKQIKTSCKESGHSISDLYGKGVNAKDIKNVLKLQTLASKIYDDKEAAFKESILANTDRINKYFDEHKGDFLKGDYIKVSANEEYYNKLKEAKTEKELKTIFIEYYVKENLLTNYNSIAETDAEALDASVFKAVEAIVAFYVCETELEGVELDDSLAVDKVKISSEKFEEVYNKFKAEGDKVSKEMYNDLGETAAKMCDKVYDAITVKSNYAYVEPEEEEADEKASEGDKAEGSAPSEKELTAAFNKWFFDDARKDNDVYASEDGKSVYLVAKAAKKETYLTKNVGHILIEVDSEADDATVAEAKKKAQEILDKFLAGEKTKDAFEALAEGNTADSGVFYDNVAKGKMVEEYEDWIYDEARKAGDTGLVKTQYGWHVMYFVGDGVEAWQATALEKLLSEDISSWTTDISTKYPVTVNEKNVTKILG